MGRARARGKGAASIAAAALQRGTGGASLRACVRASSLAFRATLGPAPQAKRKSGLGEKSGSPKLPTGTGIARSCSPRAKTEPPAELGVTRTAHLGGGHLRPERGREEQSNRGWTKGLVPRPGSSEGREGAAGNCGKAEIGERHGKVPGLTSITLQGCSLIITWPPFFTSPARMGITAEAPASAMSKTFGWCGPRPLERADQLHKPRGGLQSLLLRRSHSTPAGLLIPAATSEGWLPHSLGVGCLASLPTAAGCRPGCSGVRHRLGCRGACAVRGWGVGAGGRQGLRVLGDRARSRCGSPPEHPSARKATSRACPRRMWTLDQAHGALPGPPSRSAARRPPGTAAPTPSRQLSRQGGRSSPGRRP